MIAPPENTEMVTIEEADRQYGVRRSTLYRHIRKGDLTTYRRVMDRRVYLKRSELEALRRFRRAGLPVEPTEVAVERARAFQSRVFGNRLLITPSAELIDEARRERDEELP